MAKENEEIYELLKDNMPIYILHNYNDVYENMYYIALSQYHAGICNLKEAEKEYSNYEKESWNKPFYDNLIEASIRELKDSLKYIDIISKGRSNIDDLSIKRDILYSLAIAYYKHNEIDNALIYATIAKKYIKGDKKTELNLLIEYIEKEIESYMNTNVIQNKKGEI